MERNRHPGTFEINGAAESQSVWACVIGDTIRISNCARSGADRKELVLTCFGARSLTFACPLPRTGQMVYPEPANEWHIAGTCVGEISWGPRGHPADGEFEVRPIKAYRASAQASPQSLVLEFTGRTEGGMALCHFANSVEQIGLAPWDFRIRFVVERERFAEFLDAAPGS